MYRLHGVARDVATVHRPAVKLGVDQTANDERVGISCIKLCTPWNTSASHLPRLDGFNSAKSVPRAAEFPKLTTLWLVIKKTAEENAG